MNAGRHVNSDTGSDLARLDGLDAVSVGGQPQPVEFSHLHFDRTTRTWWGHPTPADPITHPSSVTTIRRSA